MRGLDSSNSGGADARRLEWLDFDQPGLTQYRGQVCGVLHPHLLIYTALLWVLVGLVERVVERFGGVWKLGELCESIVGLQLVRVSRAWHPIFCHELLAAGCCQDLSVNRAHRFGKESV